MAGKFTIFFVKNKGEKPVSGCDLFYYYEESIIFYGRQLFRKFAIFTLYRRAKQAEEKNLGQILVIKFQKKIANFWPFFFFGTKHLSMGGGVSEGGVGGKKKLTPPRGGGGWSKARGGRAGVGEKTASAPWPNTSCAA